MPSIPNGNQPGANDANGMEFYSKLPKESVRAGTVLVDN